MDWQLCDSLMTVPTANERLCASLMAIDLSEQNYSLNAVRVCIASMTRAHLLMLKRVCSTARLPWDSQNRDS